MPLKIIFMGTPEFAVASLKTLHESQHEVVGVVTATDKLGGRGKKKLLQSAVKQYAREQDIPVLQPEKLRDPSFHKDLKALEADLFVVVAFRMLPEIVWSMPPKGTFNLHGSLLPKYRGAAPIHWAIIKGEQETGVTTFFIQKEIDTGDMILQRSLPIGPDETAGEVHDRLMALGAETVLDTVNQIDRGGVTLQTQDDSQATKAPKIYNETCKIDFNRPTKEVHNFIRGLSPYPGAWTIIDGKVCKLLRSRPDTEQLPYPAGTLLSDQREKLQFVTADGSVFIDELKMEGKRKMDVPTFLNGYQLQDFVKN